ncbi:EpsG family protein [Photobacterium phosphoreum]|uniref:EpsG family protein n=1 Tax=Photobacterium phosphoreum TaxID=659 RepID=UPI0039AEC222
MYIFNDVILFLYFVIYVFLLIGSFYILKNKNKISDNILVAVISTVFFVFILNRTGLGVDEVTYRNAYSTYLTYSNDFKFEYSFEFLFFLLKEFGVEVKSFNNVISYLFLFLTIFTVYKAIKPNYRSIVLVSFLFSGVYIDSIFNAYRQGFSILFVILAMIYFEKKDFKYFILNVLIAVGFHWSSILIILFVLISVFLSDKILKKAVLLLIVLHIIILIYPINIFDVFNYSLLINSNLKTLSDAITSYIINGGESFYDYNITWKLITIFPVISSLTFIYIKYPDNSIKAKVFVILIGYSFIFIGMAYGFRNYYWALPVFSFLIPELTRNSDKIYRGFLCCYLLLWCFIGFFYSSILPMIYFK